MNLFYPNKRNSYDIIIPSLILLVLILFLIPSFSFTIVMPALLLSNYRYIKNFRQLSSRMLRGMMSVNDNSDVGQFKLPVNPHIFSVAPMMVVNLF